jgi:hypothetical protein
VRGAFAAVAVLIAAAAARAEDESDRASVSMSAARTTVFVGELVRLDVRIEYDALFFRAQSVPLFSRKIDVPLRVDAPWLREIRGMDPVHPAGGLRAHPLASIAVGDAVEFVTHAMGEGTDESRRAHLLVERVYVARQPGEVTLGAPELRFAYATKFEEDFIDGRRGIDRHDVVVRGEPLRLDVLPVPAEGRPAAFTGAVGRSLSIQADAARREVAAGETFRLMLRIEGDGHLASFDAPRLDGLPGFHVYGVLDDRGAAARTIAYDVAPLDASVREVPAIEWSYFDTSDPPSYRTLRTTPIPLTVRPGAGATTAAPPADDGASTGIWIALGVCAAAFVASVAWIATRRGRRETLDLSQMRRTAAAEAVRSSAASGDDVAAAFTGYLAARLDCAPAAVVGADLAQRLASAGVPEDLARRAASVHDALVASRYGGSSGPLAVHLVALVDDLERTSTPR